MPRGRIQSDRRKQNKQQHADYVARERPQRQTPDTMTNEDLFGGLRTGIVFLFRGKPRERLV